MLHMKQTWKRKTCFISLYVTCVTQKSPLIVLDVFGFFEHFHNFFRIYEDWKYQTKSFDAYD